MPALLICELRDTKARTRFWNMLRMLGASEIEGLHWADTGVEHWGFRLGLDELSVCEDYGELILYAPPEILQRFQYPEDESAE